MKVQPSTQTSIEPVNARHWTISEQESANPQALLDSLREKQKLYEKLKTEGLVRRQVNMETELAKTISELEGLITQLESKS